jgi:metal-responsive CopG/Arc/MetJ family transcriptional regulator
VATASRYSRQSVSIPTRLARRVRDLARKKGVSASKVIVSLVERGLRAEEEERARFFELAERFVAAKDAAEREALRTELARMVFGE